MLQILRKLQKERPNCEILKIGRWTLFYHLRNHNQAIINLSLRGKTQYFAGPLRKREMYIHCKCTSDEWKYQWGPVQPPSTSARCQSAREGGRRPRNVTCPESNMHSNAHLHKTFTKHHTKNIAYPQFSTLFTWRWLVWTNLNAVIFLSVNEYFTYLKHLRYSKSFIWSE